jgi:anti-anti-sigma factor
MDQHGSRTGRRLDVGTDVPPQPRFVGSCRKSRSWPCPHPAEFGILVVYEVHDVTLQLSGELTDSGMAAFESCVDSALADRPRRLVLELSALEGMDGVGVECFIGARDRAEAAGVQLVLDSPNAQARELLADGGDGETFAIR